MQVDQEVDILKRPHFVEKICLCESAEAAPHKNCSLQSQPTHEISLQSLRLDEDLRKSHKESQREKDLSTYDKHKFQTSGLRWKILEDVRDPLLFDPLIPSHTFSYQYIPSLSLKFTSHIWNAPCALPVQGPLHRQQGCAWVQEWQNCSKLHFPQIQCTVHTGRTHQYHQWISINLIRQRNCCS